MELISLLLNYGPYGLLASLVAGILSEDLLLLLIILAGASLKDLGIIALFGFIGAIIHDCAIYFIADSNIMKKFNKKIKFSKRNKGLMLFMERLGNGGYFKPLALSKFIYGTRVGIIFYAVHKEKKFRDFMLYNTLAVLIWFVVMVPMGWLAGRGFSGLLEIVNGVEKILAATILVVVIIYIARRLLSKKIKKSTRKN